MNAKTLIFAAILFPFALPGGTFAETPLADEYEIKAAMVANVFRLVDWPASKNGGRTRAVAKMAGRNAPAGHPIVIRKISGVEGIGQYHAIFMGGSDRRRLPAMIQTVGTQPVLTIGESDKFTSLGGMADVEVNLAAAQSAGLSISSRLLRIATLPGGGT